jgi:hypothetical protein
MRNSAFPANSARIQSRTLSVRPLAARALPSLQLLNPSTFQPSALRRPIHDGLRITSHQSQVTIHSSPPTSHRSRFTSHDSLLLLTSNSLRAITYATVCKYSFQKTLSLAPATLTRHPLVNSLPAITYENMGGGGVHPRVRNLLKTNDGASGHARISPQNAQVDSLASRDPRGSL